MTSKSNRARLVLAVASVGGLSLSAARSASAANAYWDVNGTTTGAAGDGVTTTAAVGTWDASTPNWNTDSTGGAGGALQAWQSNDVAVFSAGTNTNTSYAITVTGSQNIGGLTFEEGSPTLTGGALNAASDVIFSVAASQTPQIFSDITGAGRWTKTGPGTLDVRSIASTNSGGVTVSQGFVRMGNGNVNSQLGPVPASTVSNWLTLNGGGLKFANTTSLTWNSKEGIFVDTGGGTFDSVGNGTLFGTVFVASQMSGTGLFTKTGPNILVFQASNSGFSGKIKITGGELNTAGNDLGFGAVPAVYTPDAITLDGGTGCALRSSVAITIPATRGITLGNAGGQFDTTGNMLVNSVITGTGPLIKAVATGSGSLTLGAANSYAGDTTVSVGTLKYGINEAIPSGAGKGNVNVATILDLSGFSGTINGLTGSGFVDVTSGGTSTLTVGANDATSSFPGTLRNSNGVLNLTKTGNGTISLTGTNSYAGNTVVSAGTLQPKTSAALPGYNLAGRVAVGASGTLALNVSSAEWQPSEISALLSAPASFVAGSKLAFDSTNATGTYTYGNNIGGVEGITKLGAGTVALTGTNNYTGGTTVKAGTLQVNRLHENNAVNVQGGLLQVLDSSPTLPSTPSGDNAFVSRPGSLATPASLAIANDGAPLGSRVYNATLDLGNNDLIIDYSGSSPYANFQDMLRSGFNGGTWTGTGITSSTAANALANNNYALGIAENGTLVTPFGDGTGINPQFSGQTVDNTTVLIKFTHRADLNLDGVITSNDAAVFNSSYQQGASGATWQTGDLNYNGMWDSNDAAIFNSFYNESLSHLPEPSALCLLGLTAAAARVRRSRSGKNKSGV